MRHIAWIELCLILISCFFVVIFIAVYLLPWSPCSVHISCCRALHPSCALQHLFAQGPVTPVWDSTVTPVLGHQEEGFAPAHLKVDPAAGICFSCSLSRAWSTQQLQPCTRQSLCCNLISLGQILASLLSLNSTWQLLHSFNEDICRERSAWYKRSCQSFGMCGFFWLSYINDISNLGGKMESKVCRAMVRSVWVT